MNTRERFDWVKTLDRGDRVAVLHRSGAMPPTIETVAGAHQVNGVRATGHRVVRLTNGRAFLPNGWTADNEWRLHPVDGFEYLAEKYETAALRRSIVAGVQEADLPTLRLLASWLTPPG